MPYSVLNSKQKQFHGHKSYKTRESTLSWIGNFEENIDLSHIQLYFLKFKFIFRQKIAVHTEEIRYIWSRITRPNISGIFKKITVVTDYGHPAVRKSSSLDGWKSTPTPKFLGTAKAYFVCHIGPNFQISLIYAFIGCL